MKKILLATAAVALTAGAASADGVTFSGYGRFGIVSNSKSTGKKVNVTSRFRLNVAATKTTDSGVEFGAKFRMQNDQGSILGSSRSTQMTNNWATFWAKSGPFTLQVGNVSDAYDADNTVFNGDLGLLAWGDQEVLVDSPYVSYSSSAKSATQANQVGVLATYAANGLTVNISYITPDQTLKTNNAQNDEKAIGIDYTIGSFLMGVGYIKNVGFANTGSASWASFQYSFGKSSVGIQAGNNSSVDANNNPLATGNQYTLFGNTTLTNGIGLQAYVTKDNDNAHKTGYGVGASYDLGGATLLGSVAKLRTGATQADFGVKFSF